MTLNDLMIFERLSKRMNMSETAKELFISQSTVSYTISKLEEEVGVRLFIRKGRKLELTDDGRVFARHAEHIRGAYDEMMSAFSLDQSRAVLRLGFNQSAIELYATDLICDYRAVHGEVSALSTIGTPDVLREMLINGKLDAVFTSEDISRRNMTGTELAGRLLKSGKLVFACLRGGPFLPETTEREHLLTAAEMRMEELPVLMKLPEGEVDRMGMLLPRPLGRETPACRVVQMFPSFEQAMNAACRGLGVALAPLDMVLRKPELTWFDVHGIVFQDDLYLGFRLEDTEDCKVADFLQFVAERFPET